jgi:cation diffusion facilitator CzcD-associated flavoprotein CzcO
MTDTTTVTPTATADESGVTHVDCLVVGAGISGIGAAYHLQTQRPGTTFVVLDALESYGGTWLTHKYPGIRSDSDLYTFGYRFKPWMSAPIATAQEILAYLGEVIDDGDLTRHIRYHHHIETASWSSETKRWTLAATDTATGEQHRFTCSFLWMCQGYYKHAEGYTPEWPGMGRFQGRIVHPQTWPDDLDLTGKRVICIGSGATAATLVPAIANEVEHVTVLQRSPTYFWTGENRHELADQLRALDIDPAWIHEIVRRNNLAQQQAVNQLSMEAPELVKEELLTNVRNQLPEGYDVDTHFTPRYRPWQQRLAFIPDGDLFKGISAGKASMVTDEIETFTETGIVTQGGEQLDADVIITATGFHLCVLGDVSFSVDGRPVDFADTVTYRGMMFTGIPNMVWIFGYFRASWTLRVDLVCDFIIRAIGEMDRRGVGSVTPRLRADEVDLQRLSWIDHDNFNPNYLLRSEHLMPRRIDRPEWEHTQDYWKERDELPAVDLTDGDGGCLVFE